MVWFLKRSKCFSRRKKIASSIIEVTNNHKGGVMSSDNQTDLIIYETNNYDQFKYIDINRKISKNYELERSILTHNKLQYNPLVVTP